MAPLATDPSAPLDLDGYFDRIAYRGPAAPTLDALNALTLAHSCAIPFENLDILLGRPISIAPPDIARKLIDQRRGGYCFEQNGLFLEVLLALGVDARPISARVRYQRPRDYTPPRTHLFLRVDINGESWLTDVGIGGLSLTSAIRLCEDIEQATPHEARRIVRVNGVLLHQVRLGSEWIDLSEFTLEEMPSIDRELANWFTSTHPDSAFKHRLTVARALPDGGRLTILNREMTVRQPDGRAETSTFAAPRELVVALEEKFGLRFPQDTVFACPGLVW